MSYSKSIPPQVGDIVECRDVSGGVQHLIRGAKYRVASVNFDDMGLELEQVPGSEYGWHRFVYLIRPAPDEPLTLRDLRELITKANRQCASQISVVIQHAGWFDIINKAGSVISVNGEAELVVALQELAMPPKPKTISVLVTVPFDDAEATARSGVPSTAAGQSFYAAICEALKPWAASQSQS